MRKWRNDFQNSSESYYDLIDDFDLIESSFAQQYGIRLRKEIDTMKWGEFSSLLSGLNGDTALGNIVRIRSEKDPKVLKNFTKNEKEIRSKWLNKNAKQVSRENYEQAMENFKNMFKAMAKQNEEK
ncbi:MAG: hypothetical protein IJV31_02690 [Clostridia bacterium]|nr:hypothetical protein [Clostridia bacterium]